MGVDHLQECNLPYFFASLDLSLTEQQQVLGAGATIHKLVNEGNKVAVCTMANHAAARANLSATLEKDQSRAFEIMGVHTTRLKCYSGHVLQLAAI